MKTQNLLKSIFAAFVAAQLSIVSCDAAGNPSALVGRWVGISGPSKGTVMELLSDGTGIDDGLAITWKTEKDRFYVTTPNIGMAQSLSYKLQGSTIMFTYDNGEVEEYEKCNKDCNKIAKPKSAAEKEKEAIEAAKEAAEEAWRRLAE